MSVCPRALGRNGGVHVGERRVKAGVLRGTPSCGGCSGADGTLPLVSPSLPPPTRAQGRPGGISPVRPSPVHTRPGRTYERRLAECQEHADPCQTDPDHAQEPPEPLGAPPNLSAPHPLCCLPGRGGCAFRSFSLRWIRGWGSGGSKSPPAVGEQQSPVAPLCKQRVPENFSSFEGGASQPTL